MSISLTTPITGAAQTGLTTPGYVLTVDQGPDGQKQWAVTSLTGTQTGVIAHSISSPFTVTYFRPKSFKLLGMPHPVTGRLKEVPVNRHQLMVRKGVIPLANQPAVPAYARCYIDVPAGSDTADTASLRAMLSCFIGALSQISAGIGDTVVTGVS